jgi:beta-glucosidase
MQIWGEVEALAQSAVGQSIIVVDDVLSTDWLSRNAPAIALPIQSGYPPRLVDAHTCFHQLDELVNPTRPTFLQIFSRGNPFRGTAGLSKYALACFHQLRLKDCLTGLAVYGSPYVAEYLRQTLPASLPVGFTYGQMPEAQEVLLSALLQGVLTSSSTQAFTD